MCCWWSANTQQRLCLAHQARPRARGSPPPSRQDGRMRTPSSATSTFAQSWLRPARAGWQVGGRRIPVPRPNRRNADRWLSRGGPGFSQKAGSQDTEVLTMRTKLSTRPYFAHGELEQLVCLCVKFGENVELLLRAIKRCHVTGRVPAGGGLVKVVPEDVVSVSLGGSSLASDVDHLAVQILQSAQYLSGRDDVCLAMPSVLGSSIGDEDRRYRCDDRQTTGHEAPTIAPIRAESTVAPSLILRSYQLRTSRRRAKCRAQSRQAREPTTTPPL
jgi:hypothetical protein